MVLKQAAPAGSLILKATASAALPDNGLLFYRGQQIAYQHHDVINNEISLASPLGSLIPAGARLFAYTQDPAYSSLEITVSGTDFFETGTEVSIWLRRAGDAGYFPGGTPIFLPAYAGPASGLVFATHFLNNVSNWAAASPSLTVSGSVIYQTDGMQPSSGAIQFPGYRRFQMALNTASPPSQGCILVVFRPVVPGPLFSLEALGVETASLEFSEILGDPANGRLVLHNHLANQVEMFSEAPVPLHGWSMAALAWDSSGAVLYLNGQAVASTQSWLPSFEIIRLGMSDSLSVRDFTGLMDEFRYYSSQVSPALIASLWNNGLGAGLTEDSVTPLRIDYRVDFQPGGYRWWQAMDLQLSAVSGPLPDLYPVRIPMNGLRSRTGPDHLFRVIPESRRVRGEYGLIYGSHVWNRRAGINAMPLVEHACDQDVEAVGIEKFTSGVSMKWDLAPAGFVKEQHDIHPKIGPGFYFIGPDRHFLPSSDGGVRIYRLYGDGQEIDLETRVAELSPVFCGIYRRDSRGYYNTWKEYYAFYRQPDAAEIPSGLWCRVNRENGRIILHGDAGLSNEMIAVAPSVDAPSDIWFDLPVYPVWQIARVYALDPSNRQREVMVVSFDRDNGRVRLRIEPGLTGHRLMLDYVPGVAVVFQPKNESGATRIERSINLNPAFSGLTSRSLK